MDGRRQPNKPRFANIVNYLAHLFLAEDSEESMLGNLLGDFVKGPLTNQYEWAITRGIIQHRKTDVYCDAHPITLLSRNRFTPVRRRFAGIIVDICYDHFLAIHWDSYSDTRLELFTSSVYRLLESRYADMPERLKCIMPYMISQNWLMSYRDLRGVEATLNRLSRRFRRKNNLYGAIDEVSTNYRQLEADFLLFFPQLEAFSEKLRTQLNTRVE